MSRDAASRQDPQSGDKKLMASLCSPLPKRKEGPHVFDKHFFFQRKLRFSYSNQKHLADLHQGNHPVSVLIMWHILVTKQK